MIKYSLSLNVSNDMGELQSFAPQMENINFIYSIMHIEVFLYRFKRKAIRIICGVYIFSFLGIKPVGVISYSHIIISLYSDIHVFYTLFESVMLNYVRHFIPYRIKFCYFKWKFDRSTVDIIIRHIHYIHYRLFLF